MSRRKTKVVYEGGRNRKYILHACKNCFVEFYRRSDFKNTNFCKKCSYVVRRKPDIKCSVDDCKGRNYAKGLCQFHYDRLYRGTDLNEGYYGRKKIDFKVEVSGCFVCTTLVPTKAGYFMTTKDGVTEYVHRMVYRECFGEIPEGLHVRHKCDNPSCINPEHLEVGTHQQNMNDAVQRKRHAYGERSGKAKLTEKEVIQITEMISSGFKLKDIAKKFNVDPSTISQIKRGKNWRHLNVYGRKREKVSRNSHRN